MPFEFWRPVKPWIVTQAWGIYNPAYLQFGFSKHNGTDVLQAPDKIVRCPVKNLYIYDSGFGDSTGNRVMGYTQDTYKFPDGVEAKVNIIVMHGEKTLCKPGDVLQIGDPMMISDNTGFSTGPHVHVMGKRLHPINMVAIDKNDANDSFDLDVYATKFFAQDYSAVTSTYIALIKVLQQLVDTLKPKN